MNIFEYFDLGEYIMLKFMYIIYYLYEMMNFS